MLKDVVAVAITAPHRLRLTFEDGVAGEVEVARRRFSAARNPSPARSGKRRTARSREQAEFRFGLF